MDLQGRKKKFIDKKESSTFHVVHRSQQDKTNEGESKASEYVLIPSLNRKDVKTTGLAGSARIGEGQTGLVGRDHINALGLPNDGYDYESHLKTIGGGTFVSRSGRVQHSAGTSSRRGEQGGAAGLQLPEEALPSEELLERQLESVTISEKVMDGDMQRALAMDLSGYDYEEEDAGELDDDFVLQAAGDGGSDGEFDFDAHVAKLMAASAQETGLRQRTQEDDLPMSGLERVQHDSLRGRDNDSSTGSSSGEFNEALLEGLSLEPGGGVVVEHTEGEEARGGVGDEEGVADRMMLDAQFEATLAGYESDDWGELDEDDNRVHGQWDLEQHDYANKVMDEFLTENKDCGWVEGVKRADPTTRNALASSPRGVGSSDGLEEEAKAEVEDYDGEEGDEIHDEFMRFEESFEYLKRKQEERWDCDTIVSTYSNLDNHPSVLRMVKRTGMGKVLANGGDHGEEDRDATGGEDVQIELSNRTGLPVGILPRREHNKE
ncbi:unnamed protein product [Choristocarpus tenellus]